MLKLLLQDALELARTATGGVDRMAVLRMALTSDSYRITALQRVRDLARDLRVPLVNHALRVLQMAVMGVEISKEATLGHGVYFVHPVGVVIGGDAKVGSRVHFYGNNTLGSLSATDFPTVEDDVQVGAGARILGAVRIGARSRIGANAVVLQDVPPDSVAVGIPAKIRPLRSKKPDDA